MWAEVDASLVGVHTEEVAFTFCWVNWESPLQGPFFEVVEGLLDSVLSFLWIREGGPDGKIISIEWVIGSLGEGPSEVSTYKMKRARPRTMRTPGLIQNERLRAPQKWIFTLLSDRKNWVQRTKQGRRPIARSLWKRAECQTGQKLIEKSMVAKTVRSGCLFFWKPSQIDWGKRKTWSSIRSKADLGRRDKIFGL